MTTWEAKTIEKRRWIQSGIVEELDVRQVRLLEHVHGQIVHYYRHLYRTRPCYRHPLSLSRLMRLTKRSSYAVTLALKYLANTVPVGSAARPVIHYDRVHSERNASHRPYRIFLRRFHEEEVKRP